ncbi:MAG: RNA recognition motif domain-containing protein [Planctomycetota bacterium]
MGKRLYVGNLPYDADEDAIRAAFTESGGSVERVHIPLDRETQRPRGFAFVEMGNDEEARQAIATMNGAAFGTRTLRVSEAEDRRPGGGGPGGGGSGGPRGGPGGGRGGYGNRGHDHRGGDGLDRPDRDQSFGGGGGGDDDNRDPAERARENRERRFGPDARPSRERDRGRKGRGGHGRRRHEDGGDDRGRRGGSRFDDYDD